MDLSVIIVSYNVKYYLEQCLHSLYKSAGNLIDMEVFVVDNASSDKSVDYLNQQFPQEKFPSLRIIENNRNVGFGRANNQAIKEAKGEFILFLNPDTILTEKTLSDCLTFARKHNNLGGLGTMMLRDGGSFAYESRRGLPTPWVSLCKMTGLNSLFPKSRIFGKYYMRYLDINQPTEIEIISGAFYLTRKKVLDEVGYFDEDFFMYGEDIDLSYRMILGGYKNFYYPTPILHYKGESTHKSTFRYVHVFYNAMLIFIKKHFHLYWIGLSIPIKIAIILRAFLALIGWQLHRLKEFLLPIKKVTEHRFLYMGKNQECIKKIAYKWQLEIDYINCNEKEKPSKILPDATSSGKYDFVIYDSTDFSYEYILEAFKNSKHKVFIATFHPQSQTIITGAKLFPLHKEK